MGTVNYAQHEQERTAARDMLYRAILNDVESRIRGAGEGFDAYTAVESIMDWESSEFEQMRSTIMGCFGCLDDELAPDPLCALADAWEASGLIRDHDSLCIHGNGASCTECRTDWQERDDQCAEVRCEICNRWLPEWDEPETWHVFQDDAGQDVIAHDTCWRGRDDDGSAVERQERDLSDEAHRRDLMGGAGSDDADWYDVADFDEPPSYDDDGPPDVGPHPGAVIREWD